MTRRIWIASALAVLAEALPLRKLRASRPETEVAGETAVPLERHYRADAQVLVWGMPVFHREGVGGGRASWTEGQVGTRRLEFAGYSTPERAAGLHRVGFLREVSRPVRTGGAETLYFGLMSTSSEDSQEEARKALRGGAADILYSVIEGRILPGSGETASGRFVAPANLAAGRWQELEQRGRVALNSAPRQSAVYTPARPSAPPFLHALAAALRQRNGEFRYTYGGRIYRLWTHSSPDHEATSQFASRGLVARGCQVDCVSGKVQRENGGKPSEFKLWVEQNASQPVPLRIVYQPKSYLRLTFEVVPPPLPAAPKA